MCMLAGSALWCAGSICWNALCCCFKACGVKSKVFARIGYIIFSIFWILISFLLLYTAKDIFEKWVTFIHCPDNNSAWFGMSAVVRMSFILLLFHILVFLIVLTRTQIAAIFHDGWWSFKFLLVLASFIASFYISNSFFEGYIVMVRIVSVIFLIYQGITMLSLSYLINGAIVEAYAESESQCAGISLIAFTVIIYILDAIFLVYQFVWFHAWTINVIVLWVIIAFAVIFTVLVAIKTREDSSILTNAFVLSYALYLSWSAMASKPNDTCNPFLGSDSNTLYQILLGLLFTLICLFSVSVITKPEGDDNSNIVQKLNAPLVENEEDEGELDDITQVGREDKMTPEEAHVFPISVATIFFHILMMFSWMYYAVLLTNWGDAHINDNSTEIFEDNSLSYWIKISAQWACFLIYSLSLIGPLLCPDRDFS